METHSKYKKLPTHNLTNGLIPSTTRYHNWKISKYLMLPLLSKQTKNMVPPTHSSSSIYPENRINTLKKSLPYINQKHKPLGHILIIKNTLLSNSSRIIVDNLNNARTITYPPNSFRNSNSNMSNAFKTQYNPSLKPPLKTKIKPIISANNSQNHSKLNDSTTHLTNDFCKQEKQEDYNSNLLRALDVYGGPHSLNKNYKGYLTNLIEQKITSSKTLLK